MQSRASQASQGISVQRLSWLGAYFAVVFLGAALLAPWLYLVVQWLGVQSDGFRGIAQQPFHRYVSRALVFLSAVGLWPLLQLVGLNSWQAVGCGRSNDSFKRFSQGFLLGFASLALAAGVAVAVGGRVLDDRSAVEVAVYAIGALVTAIFVACLEELLFRGALFGSLRLAIGWPAALVLSSAIYALLHFFERPPQPEAVRWFSGLIVLAEMCRGFLDWKTLVPGFLNLVLAGGILAAAFQRLGTLYFSIGLHAGWIFWLKSYGFMTDEVATGGAWIWGSGKLIDGWLALIVLLLVWFVVHKLSLPRNSKPLIQSFSD